MKVVFLLTVSLILLSCSANLKDYQGTEPRLQLETFFDGKMIAIGTVFDYKNTLTRHFCVEIDGQWNRDSGMLSGVLDEQFYFDDGEQQTRIWRLTKIGDNQYEGSAGDVKGLASGQTSGQAFRWKYQLYVDIKQDDGSVKPILLSVDDWIYQLNDNTAYNESKLKKFGITVGRVAIFFDRTRKECEGGYKEQDYVTRPKQMAFSTSL